MSTLLTEIIMKLGRKFKLSTYRNLSLSKCLHIQLYVKLTGERTDGLPM